MGNIIEAAGNVFKNKNYENQTNVEDHEDIKSEEEEFNEFVVTDEQIQSNPLLGLPSDILQIIVNEIDPDLTELARLFLVSKSFLVLFKLVHVKLDLRRAKFYDSDLQSLFDYLSFVSSLRFSYKGRMGHTATITHISLEKMFRKWINLERVELRGIAGFTPAVVKNMKYLTNLVALDLQGAHLNDLAILDSLSACTELRILNLKRTSFILTEQIRDLINLRSLKLPILFDPKRPLEAFSALLDLTNLQTLHIDDQISHVEVFVKPIRVGDFPDEDLPKGVFPAPLHLISRMTQLTELSLPMITPDELLQSLTTLTNLRVLKIRGKHPDLQRLFSHISQLRQLSLCHSKVGDENLVHLSKLRYLRSLDLTGCVNITTVEHVDLPRGLTYLSLAQAKINDTSLEYISKQLPDLVNLNCHSCNQITDVGVRELVHLTNLTRLCVRAMNDKLSPYTAYQFFPWKIQLY
eukprot:TRINITY_DN3696_c0_g1_i2.p1 TRINITY_DN3696_c0_g1~~TRINITY_DN3696_c0_g1_i2.p1  ORF type:complete len:465 (-),score=50.90 TRINITY_DN3696_c0_g1_i2:681-2075(-)